MRQLLRGLGQFVVSIGEGIKALFREPECKACKFNEGFIEYLSNEINRLIDERDDYKHKLHLLTRIEQPSHNHEVKIRFDEPNKVKGIISPMKQRAEAERKSRQEHWRALADEAASLPNISETKDAS